MKTGEALFLEIARPCIKEKKEKGIISPEQERELEMCLKKNIRPRRRLLKTCFSTAFYKMRDLAQSKGKHTWDFAHVMDYWINHHNGINGCGVNILRITEINQQVIFAFDAKGKYKIVNDFNLQLEKNDCIICHKGCATVKI